MLERIFFYQQILNMNNNIKIYNYLDYRQFCHDWYKFKKNSDKEFTFKSFAKLADLKSPNYFQRIVSGKRNLSEKHLPGFKRAMNLSDHEYEYFKTLLHFDNASDSIKKTKFFNQLVSMRKIKGVHQISNNQLKYLDKWWYPIIRELVTIINFNEDYSILASSCIPKISESQAKAAVNYLLKNRYIKKSQTGLYEQQDPILSTGDEVRSLFVKKFHRENLSIGSELVDLISPEEREVSSINFSVSQKRYEKIKEEIQKFRRQLLNLVESDDDLPEKVYSASFQLFPRSAIPKNGK